jgi:excisionase family DNA binding protein
MGQMTTEVQLDTMLTVRQVADFLHVSMSTVRRWSGIGMLKSYRVGPRGDRRYLRDDVLRFLEECTSHPQCGTMMGKAHAS